VAGRQTARRKTRTGSTTAARDGRARRPAAATAPPTGFWPGQQGYAIIPWWNPLRWNWRRGLVRLWLLASVLWAGYWLYNLQLACAFWFAPWCEAPAHVDWPNGSMVLGLAMVLLSGPILMLLLGLGAIWAVKGFLARRAR
jgi:hypothetical protein